MKWIPVIFLFSFFFFAGSSAIAAGPAASDEGFSRFFNDFQKAVGSGDKEKVASTIDFANFTWEETEALQKVKSKEAFLKNYDKMFTATIKKQIAAGKPTKVDDNSYFINWHTKTNEYSLDFTRKQGEDFKFLGLTIGPY